MIYGAMTRKPWADKGSRLYKTARWQRLRIKVIAKAGAVCRMCGTLTTSGRRDPKAAEVDHIEPHHDDERLFWDESNLQLLCAACHGSVKQRQERGNRLQRSDGW